MLHERTISELAAGLRSGDFSSVGSPYSLIEADSSQAFRLRYDPSGGPDLTFDIANGFPLTGTATITPETWSHIVAVWQHDAGGTATTRLKLWLYHQGAEVTSATAQAWAHFSDTDFAFGKSAGGLQDLIGWRFAEVRIDDRAWTAAEVTDQYNRLTANQWTHEMTEYGGRRYRIAQSAFSWMDPVNPDKGIATLQLAQSSAHEHGLLVQR